MAEPLKAFFSRDLVRPLAGELVRAAKLGEIARKSRGQASISELVISTPTE